MIIPPPFLGNSVKLARFAFDLCLSPISVPLILFSILTLASAHPFGASPLPTNLAPEQNQPSPIRALVLQITSRWKLLCPKG